MSHVACSFPRNPILIYKYVNRFLNWEVPTSNVNKTSTHAIDWAGQSSFGLTAFFVFAFTSSASDWLSALFFRILPLAFAFEGRRVAFSFI